MSWQGFAVGFLGLTLLEVVVASPTASKQLGGIAAGAGTLAEKILSPAVPVFSSPPPSSSPSSSDNSGGPATPGAPKLGQLPPGAASGLVPPGSFGQVASGLLGQLSPQGAQPPSLAPLTGASPTYAV